MVSSSSSSSSSKPRSNSPFRFFKSSRQAPSLTQVLEPSGSTVSSSSSSNDGLSQTMVSRSLVQHSGRATPNSVAKFSCNSSPGVHGTASSSSSSSPPSHAVDFGKAKESVAVTIRFRPLSTRESQRGDEIAWYPDGDKIVRSEFNHQAAYAFDRVFGPATTTIAVYDAAAKHVVRGAMDGVNGTVFAYGVTSSGKTHTMHGDQKSPGIIPLAVKDVFNFIQDTPGREYLLRVSYLEIYNEVINDLLNPTQTNLRIREDAQGTYVEGVKEEVVLSASHALSLIASGEEHRHVASNNFNLVSSRSHTIFTMTIESSAHSPDADDEDVTLSLLNLIDLAGSESSKTETTGLRRKEGSFINKSLLTLGTVIGKLSEGKPTHVPFRDSKLTRLLQSSLSGHGRVSLICTITPASAYYEETHNTLKFAHRAKRVEIQAASNKIIDEKSLIKKYQKEITVLKEELDDLKRGIIGKAPVSIGNGQDDIINLRQQLVAGQVKLQSRLEEEEQAKTALLERIQRLTKLILVSSKSSIPPPVVEPQQGHRRRHSFGEDERFDKNDSSIGSPAVSIQLDQSHGSSSSSLLSFLGNCETTSEVKGPQRPFSHRLDDFSVARKLSQQTQAGELFVSSLHGRKLPSTGETMADQMDLLREQVKMLAGEVAFCSSSLKRALEQAASDPSNSALQVQIQKLKEEIQEKKSRMKILEKRIEGSGIKNANPSEISQTVEKLMSQLDELKFELEIKAADNRILQEHLQAKILENNELKDMIKSLKDQLAAATMEKQLASQKIGKSLTESIEFKWNEGRLSTNSCLSQDVSCGNGSLHNNPQVVDPGLDCQLQTQAAEIEKLKQENIELIEEKGGLQVHAQKLGEEALYAKQLASAAAVELKNLAEEVTRLTFQNVKLQKDLTTAQEISQSKVFIKPAIGDLQREVNSIIERETNIVLADKENMEARLHWKLEEAKKKEAELENDLAGMWLLISKLKGADAFPEQHRKDQLTVDGGDYGFRIPAEKDPNVLSSINVKKSEKELSIDDLKTGLEMEKRRNKEMEILISRLKSDGLDSLNIAALEDLQNLHVEALTKLCQAKAKAQQKLEKVRDRGSNIPIECPDEERTGHICKICFEAPTAAVLLPCRHFCLCKPCAVACTECPLCRSGITDRIITFTS
uniref:Kinesin 7-Ic protein n=1 Tax=Marsilea vestita TaxID=59764 RepID=A0A142KWA0_MARVE|nr:kinesin 7-Ic protein [Marsilea vestita]